MDSAAAEAEADAGAGAGAAHPHATDGGQDAARLWITTVPPSGSDDTEVVLGVDTRSPDPAERMVSVLLGRGHEGDEGLFHLLASDLSALYERDGNRLAVRVHASRAVLATMLEHRTDGLGEQLSPFQPDGWSSCGPRRRT
ncbi:hypothetical protein [Streptomyces otsuchiensis]|uniref:hypothetical protein n=1 Tax=Streptomyces otsuchiensis TaxID=2681388 RepID=UPI001031ED62|nr:hypothetical protein [Streptomyces otsuchiensis]